MKVNRRTSLISAGLLVAAVAAVWGTLLATGQGGDSSRRPEGKANVVRLQAASGEVSCGEGRAEVFVYLDDLVPRPSPDNAAVSFGLVGFELPVQYDPSVVRLIAPNEVLLNPLLGQQDIDGDGVIRSFLPVHSVNDEAGQAMIGAASYVPSSSEVADNQEEGIDPVAKGEPLLLMTLRFTPVGFGTTVIKIEPWTTGTEQPGLLDPALGRYEDLQFAQTSLTVRGGDCPLPPTPLPTLTPPPTPEPPKSPTPRPTPAPAVGIPAHDGGRTDCPADWYVYRDPDGYFSLCFPGDASATTGVPQVNFGHSVFLRYGRWSSITLYWQPTISSAELQDACLVAPSWENREEVTLDIAGREVTACAGYELLKPTDAPPLPSIFARLPLDGAGGFVTMFLTEAEGSSFAAESAMLAEVLKSLQLGE